MIDLLASSGQTEIADAIAGFLRDRLPVERLRVEAGASEHDAQTWSELAGLGCFGLSQPEEAGGIGLTLAEEVLAFREYGRHLLSPAVLGTVLAVAIATGAGQAELAQALMGGERRAGIGNATAGGMQLFDVRDGDLAVTWDDAGTALVAITGAVEAKTCFDGALTLGVMQGEGEIIARVAGGGFAARAAVLVAAQLSGIAEGTRDMAVEYAKTRAQFGQPIGAFQAVKHICADMALGAEASWAQTAYAALMLAQDTPDAPFQVWNAKAVAGQAALEAARANIQIHGGMGFTAEVNAHLYLKRAHVLNEFGGGLRALGPKLLTLPAAA